MRKRKVELLLIIIGLALTVIARDYAVARRLSMGLTPSWGGEFLILPLLFVIYAALKADWSVDHENERSDVRLQRLAEEA